MSSLPDLSLAVLERVFPRTILALAAAERTRLAREFAGHTNELHRLPAVLAEKKWGPGRGFIPDLAQLEHGLRLAALAPEIATRGFEGVPNATEPDWYGARFRFDPGHRLLDSDWPLDEAHAHPQERHERRAGTFLLYRGPGGKAQFRAVGANEEALIRSLSLGVPLGRVLDRPFGPDFDARVFQRWMETGLLRAIDWAPVQNLNSSGPAVSP